VIGDVAIDWTVRVRRLPSVGGNAWSGPPHVTPGGSGANVASGLAAQGCAVRLCGRFGDDAWGALLRDDLLERGVALALPDAVPDVPTPVVIAIVDEDGERTLLSCAQGSAQTALRAEDVPEEAWTGVGWVHATGILAAEEPSRSDLSVLLRGARERGAQISYDLNLRSDADSASTAVHGAMAEAVAASDVVFASAAEAMVLTRSSSPRDAALTLAAGHRAVVRVGADGALVVEDGRVVAVSGEQGEVVDLLGAGDAWSAGAVAALAEGASLVEATQRGHDAAAVAVRSRGARAFAPGVAGHPLLVGSAPRRPA
jgi:sugar/nucleoside kinase (ribokinase family)